MRILSLLFLTLPFFSCNQHKPSYKKIEIDTAALNKYVDSMAKTDFDSITKTVLADIKKHPVDTNNFNAKRLNSKQLSKLITCEICGYIAVLLDSGYCLHCFNSIFNSTTYKLNDKEKWVRDEQLNWFELYDKNEKVNFYGPKIESGFKKDIHWKPIITEKEVKTFSKIN